MGDFFLGKPELPNRTPAKAKALLGGLGQAGVGQNKSLRVTGSDWAQPRPAKTGQAGLSHREGVAKRVRRRRFLNLVYANLKLTRVIYA